MAVLKPELNYSSFQSNLQKVLKDLETAFRDSLDVSKDIRRDLNLTARSLEKAEKALTAMTLMSDKMERAVTAMTKDLVPGFEDKVESIEDILTKYGVSVSSSVRAVDDYTKSVHKAGEATENFGKHQRESVDEIRVFNQGLRMASDFLERIGAHANEYSNISNQLIRISGMQGDTVRDFRSGIMGVVKDLNKETGGFYNAQQAYSTVAATMQGVTGNLEAMEEMARPLLLTQETLDVNISSIASMFNRFYTRYNFTAMSMEAMVGDIRKYSAGSAATGEDIVAAQESLKVMMEYYANGNEDQLVAYNEQIAKMVGFYENTGFDPNLFLTDLIKEIEGGEFLSGNSSTLIALNKGGMSAEDVIAASKDPLRYEEISNAYLQGISNIFKELEGSSVRDIVLKDTYGLDETTAMDMHNFVSRIGDLNNAFEEYVNTRDDTPLTALVEDKYVSTTDRINNWLEQIYSKLASIQETTGIGFSDVAILLSSFASLLVMKQSLNNMGGVGGALRSFGRGGAQSVSDAFPRLFSRGAAAAGGGGATGMLPTAGTSAFGSSSTLLSRLGGGLATGAGATTAVGLASLGGIAAGGGLAFDGIKGMVDEGGDLASKSLSALEFSGGAGGAVALGALGATNPIGWTALAIGGIAFLGKKAYENATALSGNAAVIEGEIADIEKSLKSENKSRLKSVSDLEYQFRQEEDITKQRQILEKSGLFTAEDLNNKTAEQMQSMINSYKSAVSALDEITEGALDMANEFYTEKQDIQQKDFIKDLKKSNLSADERLDVISLLQDGVTDEKLQKKFSKALKDDKISKSEFKDLLTGGKNSLFDQANMKDQSLAVTSMQSVSGYLGWDKSFVDSSNMQRVVDLYNAVSFAYRLKDPDKIEEAWKDVVNSGLEDEVRDVYGRSLSAMKIPGYADGTNYVSRNQIALLHEGEAVTPRKYNPAANKNELEALREQAKNNQMRSDSDTRESQRYLRDLVNSLVEIREFLEEWKTDNIRNSTVSEARNRFAAQRGFVNGYFKTT